MAIKDNLKSKDPNYLRYRRKANQEWDLAGLARRDGDKVAEAKHTSQAREYEELASFYV